MLPNLIKKIIFLYVFIGLVTPVTQAQVSNVNHTVAAGKWADSVYQSLSDAERIAQLIFIRANYSGED